MKSPSWFYLSVFGVLIFPLNSKEHEKRQFTRVQNPHNLLPINAPSLQVKKSLQQVKYQSTPPIRHSGRNKLKEIRCRYLKCDDGQESVSAFASIQVKQSSAERSNLNNFSAKKYLDEDRQDEDLDDEDSGNSNDYENDQSNGESVKEYSDEIRNPENYDDSKWLIQWPRSDRVRRLKGLNSQKPSWWSPRSKVKNIEFGTRERIEPAFKAMYGKLPIARKEKSKEMAANQHQMKMFAEGTCKFPLEVVMKVRQFYPHPHKIFSPSCFKLHQCSNLSGCCKDGKKCSHAKTENVTLYFSITTFREKIGHQTAFEALTFINHTECACDNETMEQSRQYIELSDEPASTVNLENKIECPYPFSVRIISNGRSTCDCYDKQEDCINYKNGNKKFRTLERSCLKSRVCTEPSCNYGLYSIPKGRCLKQSEYNASDIYFGQY